MITLRAAYQNSKEILSHVYQNSEANAVLNFLFKEKFNVSNLDVLMHGENAFEFEVELNQLINRLLKHEPIQYILGFEYFAGLKILVNSDVLIPRPETEELIYWISELEPNLKGPIVDFCTGSACIALYLRKCFPNSEIIATDISEKAIELAKKSELLNFESTKIQWLVNDVLLHEYNSKHPEVVVCNPPYIQLSEKSEMDMNVLDFEPSNALFVYDSDALLFYKRIIGLFSFENMPIIYFELNPLTADEFGLWCQEKGLKCTIKTDLSGKKRFARISK